MSSSAFRAITFSLAIFALFSVLGSATSSAHHGWAGYLDAEFELTGTLDAPVSLANPHATMKIRVDGQVWDVVLAPPTRTAGAGLPRGDHSCRRTRHRARASSP
jgi:hypothetical protein